MVGTRLYSLVQIQVYTRKRVCLCTYLNVFKKNVYVCFKIGFQIVNIHMWVSSL